MGQLGHDMSEGEAALALAKLTFNRIANLGISLSLAVDFGISHRLRASQGWPTEVNIASILRTQALRPWAV